MAVAGVAALIVQIGCLSGVEVVVLFARIYCSAAAAVAFVLPARTYHFPVAVTVALADQRGCYLVADYLFQTNCYRAVKAGRKENSSSLLVVEYLRRRDLL